MIIPIPSDKPQILKMLVSCFKDNQSVNFVVKQDQKRMARIHKLMDYSYKIGEEFGEIFMNEDKTACAILVDSKKQRKNLRSIFRDLGLAKDVIGLSGIGKVRRRERLLRGFAPKNADMHLWFIAVDRQVQGQGIGTAFLKELQDYYDDKHRNLYLETSTLRNLKFYEDNGFVQTKKISKGVLGYDLFLYERNN